MAKFGEVWAETLTVVLLLLGFLVSLLLVVPFLIYLIVLVSGFLSGRILYIKRFREPIFPFILMIIGFILGYVLGNIWASRFLTFVFFILGLAVSYYLHMKKILTVFRGESFIR